MIHQTTGARQPTPAPTKRTTIKRYHPAAHPQITACVTYHDPALGIVACSIRSNLGILASATSIAFDAGVIGALQADGVHWLECHIKTIGQTYRASVETMLTHGQIQTRDGAQRVLHLKYWQVVGQTQPEQAQPKAETKAYAQLEMAL